MPSLQFEFPGLGFRHRYLGKIPLVIVMYTTGQPMTNLVKVLSVFCSFCVPKYVAVLMSKRLDMFPVYVKHLGRFFKRKY